MVIGMTRKFWIEIAKDEDSETLFRIFAAPISLPARLRELCVNSLSFLKGHSVRNETPLGKRAQFLETS